MCRAAGNQLLAAIGGTQAGGNEASSQRPRHTQTPDGGNQGTQELPRFFLSPQSSFHKKKRKTIFKMTSYISWATIISLKLHVNVHNTQKVNATKQCENLRQTKCNACSVF